MPCGIFGKAVIMYTPQGLILALVAPVSLVMGLLCVPVVANMCSAFTASDRHGQPTVLRDKLITAFKTNCRPTIKSKFVSLHFNIFISKHIIFRRVLSGTHGLIKVKMLKQLVSSHGLGLNPSHNLCLMHHTKP